MADWQDMNLAKATFETMCRTLDNNGWHYARDDEKLRLKCGARGDDLPIDLTLAIDAERMLIMVFSHLPGVIPEDKRLDTAVAVSVINNMLAHGCFDFDLSTGHLFYRMTNNFIESQIGEELFFYMLMATCNTVDEYNDKFLMLGKGMITIGQFLDALNH
ncbi:MAG: hypothetical protein E7447_03355 [Ruminococcaceae bacterium]|nr:hypothetical protein [Oscillospiraceae bacterium]